MQDTPSRIALLIVAAGRGARFGEGVPKQYRNLGGAPLLAVTLRACHAALPDAAIVVVINASDKALFQNVADHAAGMNLSAVTGGATRQESVWLGLQALQRHPPDLVLIHDGVRPFATPELFSRVINAASATGSAIPGLPLTDTIKQIDAAGMITGSPDRARLMRVQTPQAFAFAQIFAAHARLAATASFDLTDDAAVMAAAGYDVAVVAGDSANVKVTFPEDLQVTSNLTDTRTGQGFDVHAFGPGDHVMLGGVRIPHHAGLVGHSDADVLLHALTDALYGALADGDIGQHFPPHDPQWRGQASSLFFRHALARLAARHGRLAHLDATLICETPKIGPHAQAIRENIAALAGISLDRVALKATTSERLGFTGRGEGMAAMAIATIRLPGSNDDV
ncbi:MAG: bifunctional 2-C-methyl-D-erythritol 4-phosphate cytidylyltransferase/2-C-methyl-D-erythritol 2,4-cyclodiphosphate synthase [Hyphomicrobiales bacterium]|nr:bifunctional 2-C-methyl-D-erythritol 4-phosphate cytidylyltransferase/2-C-methyl-D-erythritol 2,4-cyclodiphosphate synthase [Hyphomicrobiales bacterium]